jgi:DNA-binding MarR family transcriptional regulator
MSAGALAAAAGLTRGAMTTALDRLENAGCVDRVRDQQDRRTVRVEVTAAARKEIATLYGPLAAEGGKLLQGYSAPELSAIARYLEDGRQLQRTHAQRIRELATTERGSRRITRSTRKPL